MVSKPSIRSKVKAGWVVQPDEYMGYFEDWTFLPNAEIGPEGRF
jgi:hypothetical protein